MVPVDIEKAVQEIAKAVQGKNAVVFVSGGVDSAVTAVLAKKALGGKAVFWFIDNGLQRKGENARVKRNCRKILTPC